MFFQHLLLSNPQRGYVKIDAHLLHILCHMSTDVELSQCFFRIKGKNMFLAVKSFRKHHNLKAPQKQPLRECRKTSAVEYTSR